MALYSPTIHVVIQEDSKFTKFGTDQNFELGPDAETTYFERDRNVADVNYGFSSSFLETSATEHIGESTSRKSAFDGAQQSAQQDPRNNGQSYFENVEIDAEGESSVTNEFEKKTLRERSGPIDSQGKNQSTSSIDGYAC